jgi:uncharacterized protein YndB with AHSA1/START domain
MKALKLFVIATGGLIVLAFFSLFMMGRRPDAGRISGVVEIAAPPEVVMTWLTEPAKMRRWVGWLADVKGDTSAVSIGRKQVWVMDDGHSGAVSIQTELAAFAPPDSMRLRLEVPGMVEGENFYQLENMNGGTRLTVNGRYHHPNPIIALLEPLATPEAAAKLKADLDRLRTQVAAFTLDASGAAPDSSTAGPGPEMRKKP